MFHPYEHKKKAQNEAKKYHMWTENLYPSINLPMWNVAEFFQTCF